MALMKYREGNEIEWVGIRPGHRGTQVAARGGANNSTVIIHTVTAGKIFCMSAASVTMYGSGAGQAAQFLVRDDEDTVKYYIIALTFQSAGQIIQHYTWNPPLEIPTGYDLVAVSNNPASVADIFIHGWEEGA